LYNAEKNANLQHQNIDMKGLRIYIIVTYILLPIAGFIGLVDFFMLLMAIRQPQVLLDVFITGCVTVYTFASYRFLKRVVLQPRNCTVGIVDWIKVNAYVSVFFAFRTLYQSLAFVFNKNLQQQAIQQVLVGSNLPKESIQMLPAIVQGTIVFLLLFVVLLLIHIVLSFFAIKHYRHHLKHAEE
jgi:hypothetical protein